MSGVANKSRFFAGDSDEDSDDRSETSSQPSEEQKPKTTAKPIQSRFAELDEDDSDSDDEDRVVRSEKEKRFDAIQSVIGTLRNHMKINNWVEIEEELKKLTQAVDKTQSIIKLEGMPRFVIRLLADLEDAVNAVAKADTKKMSKGNATSYNRVRMNLKKYNAAFQTQIEDYRKNPDAADAAEETKGRKGRAAAAADDSSDDEVVIGRMGVQVAKRKVAHESSDSSDDSSDSDSSDSDAGPAPAAAPAAAKGPGKWMKAAAADDEDEDDSEFGSDSESDTDSDEDEAYKGLTGRARWVKRAAVGKSKDDKEKEKDERRNKDKDRRDKKRQQDEEKAARADAAAASAPTPSAATVDIAALESLPMDMAAAVNSKKWTRETLEEELKRAMAMRGRKGTDAAKVVMYVSLLADKALEFGPHSAIPALMHAVSARFDLSARGVDAFLDRPTWKRSLRDIGTLLSLLEGNDKLKLAPVEAADLAEALVKRSEKDRRMLGIGMLKTDGTQDGEEVPAAAAAASSKAVDDSSVVRVVGDLSVLVDRLQDEYVRSLQHIDPHKTEYVVRISDEAALTAIADRAFVWYSRQAREASAAKDANAVSLANDGASRLAMLRIEHMYYKHDSIAYSLRVAAATADMRAEVAAIAASAASAAMEEARKTAVEANKVASTSSAAPGAAGAVSATPTKAKPGNAAADAAKDPEQVKAEKEAAEAANKAIAAAANASVVGDKAARLAEAAALTRNKKGYAVAAGVVAKALVQELSRREGGLLSGGAVALSRKPEEMEAMADVETPKALADAHAAGLDLGDLKAAVPGASTAAAAAERVDTAATIADLASFIYAHGEPRSRIRAVLCHVYHHALHDHYTTARDLLLMSKLQDNVASMSGDLKGMQENVKLQVQYNRSLTMLGIAAFRAGLWADAHECLAEICGSGHTRELLAQGLPTPQRNQQERDVEAEKEARRRLVPYHMHINIELADACHLTGAMLLEVPNIAAAEHDPRRREISRFFRRQLDTIDHKPFVGPPESNRDHIMLAALNLAEGEWKRAEELVLGLKIWALWTGRGVEAVREKLSKAIKEAGLATYLHTYGAHYDSVSRQWLSDVFSLPAASVSAQISKLVYQGELDAKWDQPTSTLVMTRTQPSRLQQLALDFAGHVAALADVNERAMGAKTGQGGGGSGGEYRRGGGAGGGGGDRGGDRGDRGDRGAGQGGEGGAGGNDGQYRRQRGFDPRRQGGAANLGRAGILAPGGGGGRGRGRGRGGYGGGAGGRGYGSGRRDYKQRGY